MRLATPGTHARRAALVLLLAAAPAAAQTTQNAPQTSAKPPRFDTTVTVTTDRTQEKQIDAPSSVVQITGAELAARGVTTLADALTLLPGLEISAGGDAGPMTSGVALWGLREFDAYALFIDGVPAGGVYNPNTAFVPVENIERIEVVKGPNAVLYGQTAFAGIIQIFTRTAQAGRRGAMTFTGGTLGTVGASGALDVIQGDKVWRLSFLGRTSDGWQPRAGVREERVDVTFGKPLAAGAGQLRIIGRVLDRTQGFGAPFPRAGAVVAPGVSIDRNYAVNDARIADRIAMGTVYVDRPLGRLVFVSTSSVSFNSQSRIRSFLTSADPIAQAQGSALSPEQLDIFNDTHVEWHARWRGRPSLLQAGGGYQFGRLEAEARLFDYTVSLADPNPPSSTDLAGEEAEFFNRRSFGGAYVHEQLGVTDRLTLAGGVRVDFTRERSRVGGDKPGEESATDQATHVAPSYRAATTYRVSMGGPVVASVYGSFNHAFKPAAVNFGEPESQGPILEPETADAVEGGVKLATTDGHLSLQASMFQMDFKNLVVSHVKNGLVVYANAGAERFRGVELYGEVAPAAGSPLRLKLGYAFHNPIFTSYTMTGDDGTQIVLDGNRLELAPKHLWNAEADYLPETGFGAFAALRGAGKRPVNRRNSAFTDPYTVVDLGASYAFGRYRFVGKILNVNDSRHIIAESELADGQVYLNPPRRGTIELHVNF